MTLIVNDINPSTVGAYLDSKAPLRIAPAKRGGNISVPLADGAIFLPEKRYEEGDLVVTWLIEPRNPVTKTITLGSSDEHMEKNISDFIRLIGTDTVTLKNTRKNGFIRQFTGEVVEVVPFEMVSKKPKWHKVAVHFKVVSSFWEDTSYTNIFSFALTSGASRILTELAEAEARMSNMILTMGPSTNYKIQQAATGIYVQYNGVISAGRVLNVNTQTGTLSTTGGTAWTPDEGSLVHSGDSRLFSLRPEKPSGGNPTGSPTIFVTHTGGGTANTSMIVLKKYMTG